MPECFAGWNQNLPPGMADATGRASSSTIAMSSSLGTLSGLSVEIQHRIFAFVFADGEFMIDMPLRWLREKLAEERGDAPYADSTHIPFCTKSPRYNLMDDIIVSKEFYKLAWGVYVETCIFEFRHSASIKYCLNNTAFFSFWANVRNIEIKDHRDFPDVVDLLADRCPRLRSLTVRGCAPEDFGFDATTSDPRFQSDCQSVTARQAREVSACLVVRDLRKLVSLRDLKLKIFKCDACWQGGVRCRLDIVGKEVEMFVLKSLKDAPETRGLIAQKTALARNLVAKERDMKEIVAETA